MDSLYCFLIYLKNLARQPSGWWPLKYCQTVIWVVPYLCLVWLDRNVGWTSIAARVLPAIASSYERYLSFFLLVIFRNGSGPWEGDVLCTRVGGILLMSNNARNAGTCTICPGRNMPRYLKGFLSSSMVRSWPDWKLIFKIWQKTF